MHPESHLRLLDSFGDSAFQEKKLGIRPHIIAI